VKASRAVLFSLLLIGAACGTQTVARRRTTARRATRIETPQSREDHSRCDASRPGRSQSEYDTNGDGVTDVRKVYEMTGEGVELRSTLVCREVDLNHDGTKDVFRFYNSEGRTLREEEDRDFDGRIDVVSFFERGEVVRREHDLNRDGQVDMRVFYRDRRPYRAEREVAPSTDATFRADYWEYYDARGHVVRIGWDYNGDERADQWDRVDRVTPSLAGALAGDGEEGDGGSSPMTEPDAAVIPDPSSAGDAGLGDAVASRG
jgi:hypothetical protein